MGYDRRVDPETGILHSHRIITSDWALAPWVQRLIGANRECYAHEYSSVDPKSRMMEMKSINLTFCSWLRWSEKLLTSSAGCCSAVGRPIVVAGFGFACRRYF